MILSVMALPGYNKVTLNLLSRQGDRPPQKRTFNPSCTRRGSLAAVYDPNSEFT